MKRTNETNDALIDDLENQINELMAGMDQVEAERDRALARVGESEDIMREVMDAWSGGDVQKAQMYAAVVRMEKTLAGDGSAVADVLAAARAYRTGDTGSELALMRAVDALDGKDG